MFNQSNVTISQSPLNQSSIPRHNPQNGSYSPGHPIDGSLQNNEIAKAVENTFALITRMFDRMTLWWSPPPPVAEIRKQKIQKAQAAAFRRQSAAFDQEFDHKLEFAMNNWNDRSMSQLVGLIEKWLANSLTEEIRKAEKIKIVKSLKENLTSDEFNEIIRHLIPPMKRSVLSQSSFLAVESTKQFFSPNELGIGWGNPSLCVSGSQGMFYGTTGFTNMGIMLFSINSSIVERLESASSVIQSEIQQRQGANHVEISCHSGLYHIITTDSRALTGVFHQVIANSKLEVAQYQAAIGTSRLTRSWKPAALLGGQAAFAPLYDTDYYLAKTNASGLFDSQGKLLAQTSIPKSQEVLSFTDGSFRVLQALDQPGITEIQFDPNGTMGNSVEINGGNALFSVVGPNTPIPIEANFTTLISPGLNGETPSLHTYDLIARRIIFNRLLGNESNALNFPTIAQCTPLFPHVSAYARESYQIDTGKWIIKYDVVDSSSNSQSLIGGEKIYQYPPLSANPEPKIGCSSETVMISFLDENRDASYFTVQLLDPDTLQPSIINITIPPDLDERFVPVTTDIISISNNTVSIKLIDENGYQIVFTANLSDVPLNVDFVPGDVKSFSIARKNASIDDAPVFEGCIAEHLCSKSRTEQQAGSLDRTFNIEGVDLRIVLPLAIGLPIIIGVIGTVVYFIQYRPMQAIRIARYQENYQGNDT